uniref:G-protein-signaling modulator 2 n=1 Tax=Steinernema glaseri TaxID=37863 RepID=A0A1I7ZE52_9BILA
MNRVCRSDDSVSAEVSAVSRLKSVDAARFQTEENESECLALAQEGERLIRDNDVALGIQYLEKALEVGTKKVQLLTAIYSQLGNAYFSTRNYTKALKFHHNDLLITKLMKDLAGEAKACGNLGNTYKALSNYKDAIYYCEVHLKIARSIDEPTCVARALYNLATVFHSKGRQNNPSQPNSHDLTSASVSQAYKDDLNRAVELYKQNLEVVEQLDDPYARGRTYGNLGNVFYLLGDFETAVLYHQKRLDIARQFGDRAAMRRAYSNLGNAHVYMSKLEEAVQYYKLALAVAQEQGDRIGEAQVCFGLGNSATIQGDFDSAVDYHLRHLSLARELKDRAGEARACASLAVNFENKSDRPKALYFLALNKKLAQEMRDHAMEVTANDQIKQLLQGDAGASLIVGGQVKLDDSADPRRQVDHCGSMVGSRSMPNLLSSSLQSLIMKTCMANGVSATPLDSSLHSSTSIDCGLSRTPANELFNASKMSKFLSLAIACCSVRDLSGNQSSGCPNGGDARVHRLLPLLTSESASRFVLKRAQPCGTFWAGAIYSLFSKKACDGRRHKMSERLSSPIY